jgi:O-antigen/teichoic acid export membrane protein
MSVIFMSTSLATEAHPADNPPVSTYDKNILIAAKGGGIMFVGILFEYAGRLAIGILLARFMGAQQYGLYSLADSTIELCIGITLLGLDMGIVHFVAIYSSRRDDASLWETVQIGLGVPLVLSLVGGVGLYAFAAPLAREVFHAPELAPVLRVAAFALPGCTLMSGAAAVTRGFKTMHYQVIAQSFSLTLIKLLLIVLFTFTGLNAVKAMTAQSLSTAIACLMLVYFAWRLLPRKRPAGLSRKSGKRLFTFSLPVYLTYLLQISGPNLRIMLLGALGTVASVGVFTVAARISMFSGLVYRSVGAISMPIVSDLYSKREREQLGRFYQTSTKWIFTFNLPIFLLIVLFRQPILAIFGQDFVTGSIALVILACGDMVNAATGICGTMVTMTENTILNALNSLVTLALTLLLSVLLIPGLGAVGAALAMVAGSIAINVIQVSEVFVLFRLLPYNRSFIKPVIAGLVSAVVTFVTAYWVLAAINFVSAMLCMSLFLAIYACTLGLLGLSEEDRFVLKRVYGRISQTGILKKGIK